MLAACGGGGGGSSQTSQGLSQDQIESDAGNGSQLGNHSAGTFDNVLDTTQLAAEAAAAQGSADGAVVNCAGGGTATITITGGTPASQLNGQFDAGEHDEVQFEQCRGELDFAQLDGMVDIDIVSATAPAGSRSFQAAMSLKALRVTLPLGNLTLGGDASLARTVTDDGSGATTTSTEFTSRNLSAATTFHNRSGEFQFSSVDLTRTVDRTNGVVSGSSLTGQFTVSGSAGGFHFSDVQVTSDGNANYDGSGNPLAGAWTAVHGNATIHVSLADGVVTVELDRNSDGVIGRTWTFPLQHLLDSEG
jgi:hypothetical protein